MSLGTVWQGLLCRYSVFLVLIHRPSSLIGRGRFKAVRTVHIVCRRCQAQHTRRYILSARRDVGHNTQHDTYCLQAMSGTTHETIHTACRRCRAPAPRPSAPHRPWHWSLAGQTRCARGTPQQLCPRAHSSPDLALPVETTIIRPALHHIGPSCISPLLRVADGPAA
jgi:ribosomal protein L37E